jgi:hypothetical protein
LNEQSKVVLLAEVKRNPENSSLPKLQQKAQKLLQQLQGYEVHYKGLSLQDL